MVVGPVCCCCLLDPAGGGGRVPRPSLPPAVLVVTAGRRNPDSVSPRRRSLTGSLGESRPPPHRFPFAFRVGAAALRTAAARLAGDPLPAPFRAPPEPPAAVVPVRLTGVGQSADGLRRSTPRAAVGPPHRFPFTFRVGGRPPFGLPQPGWLETRCPAPGPPHNPPALISLGRSLQKLARGARSLGELRSTSRERAVGAGSESLMETCCPAPGWLRLAPPQSPRLISHFRRSLSPDRSRPSGSTQLLESCDLHLAKGRLGRAPKAYWRPAALRLAPPTIPPPPLSPPAGLSRQKLEHAAASAPATPRARGPRRAGAAAGRGGQR